MSVKKVARRSTCISIKDVERVAARLFTLRQWLEKYGTALYRVSRLNTFRQRKKIGYDSWVKVQLDHRIYVYLPTAGSNDVISSANEINKKVDLRELRRLELDSQIVYQVFNRLFSVKEWIEQVGVPLYDISNPAYVYQMCAERMNGPRGYRNYPAHLPEGWHSVRVGESWLIYHHSLKEKSHWSGLKRQNK